MTVNVLKQIKQCDNLESNSEAGGAAEVPGFREDLLEQMSSGLSDDSFLALLKCRCFKGHSRWGEMHVQKPCGEKELGPWKGGLCGCPYRVWGRTIGDEVGESNSSPKVHDKGA